MDGFGQPLRGQIKQRLQYLKPTHFPDDPYDWKEVHDSTYFLLSGTPSAYPPNTTPRIPQITGQATPYIPTTTAQPPPMTTISYQPAQVAVAPTAALKVKWKTWRSRQCSKTWKQSSKVRSTRSFRQSIGPDTLLLLRNLQ